MDREWTLTDQEIAYIEETGADMAEAQEVKKQAYIKAGGVILNPDALLDMYEALKESHKVFFIDLKTAYSPEQNAALIKAFAAIEKAERNEP